MKGNIDWFAHDWHHPHSPIDRIHPMCKRLGPDEAKEANTKHDAAICREYLHNQVARAAHRIRQDRLPVPLYLHLFTGP